MSNFIDDTVHRDQATADDLYQQASYDDVPDYEFWRQLRRCIPPDIAKADRVTIERAREMIYEAVDNYRLLKEPSHMLLVQALPGIGKTFVGVAMAEREALDGKSVAYAGPRHDFYTDIMAIAKYPELWYEWLPRQTGDGEKVRTCDYTEEINGWLAKGYDAIDFCSGICGWGFVKNGCPYHAQKKQHKDKPIMFLQHAHVALGHPLKFDLLIGDEDPTGAFLHKWRIPAKSILPPKMTPGNGITELFMSLAGLAASGNIFDGDELLDMLGGPQKILDVFERWTVPWDAVAAGQIHTLDEAEYAGYFHMPKLASLLQREANLALQEQEYIHRIIVGKDGMTLLLRHALNDTMPKRKIWLDATGNRHIYQELFQQPVQTLSIAPMLAGAITVVTDRANNKGIFQRDDDRKRHVEQINRIINRVTEVEQAERIGVVSFQELVKDGELLAEGREALNFYGARGTNRLENVDVLFVVGTPMPEQAVYKSVGAMLYFDRDEPFNDKWSSRWLPYNYVDDQGAGWEYPTGGFWGDRDLAALHWQMCEAEIIQAVHRARPLLHPCKIYVLSNRPILEMRVDRLVSSSELFGVPDGIDQYRWSKFVEFMESRTEVTTTDVRNFFGKMTKRTARKYLEMFVENNAGWEIGAFKTGNRGQMPMGARRIGYRLVNCERT